MVDVQKLYRKLYALGAIKAASREAIEDKNGTLEEDAPFSDYPDGIRSIPSGGGDYFTVPEGMKFRGSTLVAFPAGLVWTDIEDADSLFQDCKNLIEAPVVPGPLSNAKDMFYGCTALMVVPALSLKKGASCSSLFSGCLSLQSVPEMKVEKGACDSMFSGCAVLTDLSHIEIETDHISSAFKDCASLIALPTIKMVRVESEPGVYGAFKMSDAFKGCSALAEITIQLDSENYAGTDMVSEMFSQCSNLSRLNLSFTNFENASIRWVGCFSGCEMLTELPLGFWENAQQISCSGPNGAALPRYLASIPAFDASKLTGAFTLAYKPYGADRYELVNIGEVYNLNPSQINLKYATELGLQPMVNLVKGLTASGSPKTLRVGERTLQAMQADWNTYTWNGQTYTGIIALANAKGWTVGS